MLWGMRDWERSHDQQAAGLGCADDLNLLLPGLQHVQAMVGCLSPTAMLNAHCFQHFSADIALGGLSTIPDRKASHAPH
jgi:hypothetical protein